MLKRRYIDRKGMQEIGLTYGDAQLARMERKLIEITVKGEKILVKNPDPFPHRVYLAVIEHRNNKPFWPYDEVMNWLDRQEKKDRSVGAKTPEDSLSE